MNRILAVLVVLTGLLAAFATAQAAISERQRLDDFLKDLHTLKARFVQIVDNRDKGRFRASGVLYVRRPDQFRWEYSGEEGQTIVADGHRIWVYDKELEQISHKSQTDALRGTPAQILVNDGSLEQYFDIEDAGKRSGLTWLRLTPRKKAESDFEKVMLGFAGDELREMVMVDSFGQTSDLRFSDIERNVALDPNLFHFRPPPGIDVLGDD